MGRTQEQYRDLLISLLPPGDIWKKDLQKDMSKLLYGLAMEFSRLESRAEDLLRERDSRYVTELLEEFEAEYGIPEFGLDLEPTIERRRAVVRAKVIAIGDQDKDYFEEIASELGYSIRIEEYTPAWAGVATAGSTCGDQDIIFKWMVWIDADSIEYSIDVNITQLIADITRVKPGNTEVYFRWEGPAFARGFSRGFDSIPHFDNRWPDTDLGFDGGFSNGFTNNVDYYGVNMIGGFAQGFAIGFDVYSGGGFSKGFSQGFSQMN